MLHASLTEIAMPERIARLPHDHRGFPVPRFVAWIDGQADHRVVDPAWIAPAVNQRRCWMCGEPLGRYFVSIIGCMCAVNRVISEPPSHRDCATYAVKACPFMARPQAHRRAAGLPEDHDPAAGFGLKRNPGVTCLWISKKYPQPFHPRHGTAGVLFALQEPIETQWWRLGRLATREEVLTAIDEGLPTLLALAEQEEPAAVLALAQMTAAVTRHLPA